MSKKVNILFSIILAGLLLFDWGNLVSPWWYAVLLLIYLNIHAYGASVLSAQFFLPVKFQGDAQSKKIAITFDDGPIPVMTEKILDILKSYKVPAAFFCIGNRVDDYPNLAKQINE